MQYHTHRNGGISFNHKDQGYYIEGEAAIFFKQEMLDADECFKDHCTDTINQVKLSLVDDFVNHIADFK